LANAYKVLIQGQLGNTVATLATVGALKSWVISKITGEITGRRVSPKVKIHQYLPNESVASPAARVTVADTQADLRDAPCLTDDEIRALAAVARRVEAHYGAPQDIEWAVLDGEQAPEERVVLLQSRPETVWASRDTSPAGAPKPRPADHVLSLFGKPL